MNNAPKIKITLPPLQLNVAVEAGESLKVVLELTRNEACELYGQLVQELWNLPSDFGEH